MIGEEFRKKIYGLGDFFRDGVSLIGSLIALFAALRSKKVGKALHAKLNMAVIGVLGCRYCSWLHSEVALLHGIEDGELQKLLSLDLGDFSENESVALAFAQHYSETGGRPRKEAEQRLYDYYGRKTAEDILVYLKVIYFGNLAGNTVEAFLYRLKGRPVDGSTLLSELIISLIVGPYYLVILPVIASVLHRKQRTPER